MPSFNRTNSGLACPGHHPWKMQPIRTYKKAYNFTISGVTRDSLGAALGNCTVQLFRSGTDELVGKTTSDGSGNYSFTIPDNAGYFYAVAYKAGSPDVSGSTVNTIVGA